MTRLRLLYGFLLNLLISLVPSSVMANPVPTGACCFPDLSCEELSDSLCVGYGGHYLGDGTVCDPNPCLLGAGACCNVDDGSCIVTDRYFCDQGVFQGEGTVCDPNPCMTGSGACCLPDGSCIVTNALICGEEGGEFQGDYTICEWNTCQPATGACCMPDGQCAILVYSDCLGQGGIWAGGTCEPCNPCRNDVGACCMDYGCVMDRYFNCCMNGGTFHAGVTCDQDPCTSPTRPTTWGQIKNLYR